MGRPRRSGPRVRPYSDSEDVEQTIDVFSGGGLCGGKEEVQQEKVEQHAD